MQALAEVKRAYAACRALGFTSSAIVVVGRGGDTIIAASDDNARPHAREAARRKAYTARTFAIPRPSSRRNCRTAPRRFRTPSRCYPAWCGNRAARS